MTLFGYELSINRGQIALRNATKPNRAAQNLSKLTLVDIAPGCQAKVVGFSQTLSPERRAHLLSYGLVPGYRVRIVQHSPVTVLQVEHMELALERDLAVEVLVTDILTNQE